MGVGTREAGRKISEEQTFSPSPLKVRIETRERAIAIEGLVSVGRRRAVGNGKARACREPIPRALASVSPSSSSVEKGELGPREEGSRRRRVRRSGQEWKSQTEHHRCPLRLEVPVKKRGERFTIGNRPVAHRTFFQGNPWQKYTSNLSAWVAPGRSGPHVERI